MKGRIPVYLEVTRKRTFAGAVAWPGWCRSGKTPEDALEALVAYADRYAAVISRSRLGFERPGGVDDLDLNLGDFVARVNADLVGKFVNLASRCAGFIEKRFDGQLAAALPEPAMYARFVEALAPVREAYERNEPATVLRLVMALADEANKYIDERKPWLLAKQDGADSELHGVCAQG